MQFSFSYFPLVLKDGNSHVPRPTSYGKESCRVSSKHFNKVTVNSQLEYNCQDKEKSSPGARCLIPCNCVGTMCAAISIWPLIASDAGGPTSQGYESHMRAHISGLVSQNFSYFSQHPRGVPAPKCEIYQGILANNPYYHPHFLFIL